MQQKIKLENERIQSYYDAVKKHIKTKSKQEKIIVKYKHLKLLYEKDLDAEKDNKLLHFQQNKISTMQKANKYSKVISIKLDTKENGSYTNPFMPRAIDWLKLDIEAYKQFKEDKFSLIQKIKPPQEKKEKEVNIQSKKFNTADKN